MAAVTNITCCSVQKAYDALLLSRKGCLSNELANKNALFQAQASIIDRYVPSGVLIQAGFVSSAIIDLNSFSAYANPIIGIIRVNGAVIGILPETSIANVSDLIDALIQAIADGGSGYGAINNGDGTITVISPSSALPSNGFNIAILLNPDFEVSNTLSLTVNGVAPVSVRQMIHIEQGGFNGVTAVAVVRNGKQQIDFISSQAIASSLETYPNPINGSGAYALVYNPASDRVLSVANINTPAWAINSSFSYASSITGINNGVFAVYNPVNTNIYFINQINNRVDKLASNGTVTNIAMTGIFTTSPLNTISAVDTINGGVWVLGTAGANGIRIIDPSTDGITSINTGADQPRSLTFYPGDGTPGSERMFVGFSTFVREYDSSGVVITSSFYSSSNCIEVFYSSIYNVLFCSGGANIDVVDMTGTIKQTLSGQWATIFQEDADNGFVLGVNSSSLIYIILTTDGTEKFTATLENGTPDVFTDGSTNCITEDQYNNAIQNLTSDCGCCGNEYDASETNTTPTGVQFVIYYGNATSNPANEAAILSLDSVTQPSFVGTYSYDATSPSEYKVIAYPAILGTPTRFYDVSTGFDVPMQSVYQITVNSVVYNVYVSSFALGGALTIGVTA